MTSKGRRQIQKKPEGPVNISKNIQRPYYERSSNWDEISSFIYQISIHWKMVNFKCWWMHMAVVGNVNKVNYFESPLGGVRYSVIGCMRWPHNFTPSILSQRNILTYDPNLFTVIFSATRFIIRRVYHSESPSPEGGLVCLLNETWNIPFLRQTVLPLK